jgi:hypothetical protein
MTVDTVVVDLDILILVMIVMYYRTNAFGVWCAEPLHFVHAVFLSRNTEVQS